MGVSCNWDLNCNNEKTLRVSWIAGLIDTQRIFEMTVSSAAQLKLVMWVKNRSVETIQFLMFSSV